MTRAHPRLLPILTAAATLTLPMSLAVPTPSLADSLPVGTPITGITTPGAPTTGTLSRCIRRAMSGGGVSSDPICLAIGRLLVDASGGTLPPPGSTTPSAPTTAAPTTGTPTPTMGAPTTDAPTPGNGTLAQIVGAARSQATPVSRDEETPVVLPPFHPRTTPLTAPEPIIDATFDDLPVQNPISPDDFQSQLGGTNNSTYDYDDTSIVDDPRGSGKVIRTKLKGNTYKSEPDGNNGIAIFPPLPRQVDQACISYDLHFDSNFEFDLGGKLPGVLGMKPGASPGDVSGGGNPGDAGFSQRIMWLGPDAYSWATPPGFAVSYMYSPNMHSEYGDNVKWEKAFQAGKWHKVKTCMGMNTVGKADGILRAWLDGQEVVNDTAYTYRLRDDVHIGSLSWSIFRGGGDMEWAAPHDGYVDIDNVLVTEGIDQ